jgi:replicative DNA helicase
MSTVIPPFSEEIEECLLGSILIDPSVLPAVREILNGQGDFYIDVNQAVYSAICRLADQGLDLDVVTICAMLPREIVAQTGKALGEGLDYEPRLSRYQIDTPTACHALSYARIVRGLKVRRLALTALERCLPHVVNWQNGKPIVETLDLLINYLTDLRRQCCAAQQEW